MSGRFTVEAVFKAVDKLTAPVRRMSGEVDKFTKATEKGLSRVASFNEKISSGIKRAAAVATGAALATAAIIKDVVTTGAAFDRVLVAGAAKFDPMLRRGTAGFESLRLAAEDIGERTEFNAQQGAEALKGLAASGFKAGQAIAVLPGIVDLATAAEVDLGVASEMATKSLGAFGLRVEESTQLAANLARVNDVMAKTAGETEASMEGLFESIKEGGPISKAAGASMETFMALTGRLARAGIEGSVAGTTLKNVFTSFSTKKGTAALGAIGIKTKDANGKMRDAIDILGDLEKKTAGMGSAKRLGLLEGIFGKIPLAGVATLLDQGTDSIRELRTELEKAKGSSTRLADAMRDTVAGDIDELSSSIDGVKIALFSTNSPKIREGLQKLTDFVRNNKAEVVEKIGNAIKWIGDNLGSIVKWTKRIATGIAIFYAFSTVVKAMQLAVAGYESAVALATAAQWLFKTSVSGWSKIPDLIGKAAQAAGLFDVEVAKVGKGMAGWREALNAGALSQKINGITGLLGWAGMLAAAAGVGYAIGSWLNELFGFDQKLEGLIEKMTGLDDKLKNRDAKGPGLDPKGDKVFGDHSIQRADGTWKYKSPQRLAREAAAAKKLGNMQTIPLMTPAAPYLDAPPVAGASSVVSPQETTARSIAETTTTEKSEVTIKDETGRAEVTKKAPSIYSTIILQRSGAF